MALVGAALLSAACGGSAGRSATPASSTTSSSAPASPCTAGALAASTAPRGLPDVVALTDRGPGRCWLQGYLGLSLPDVAGKPLTIEVVHDGMVGTDGFRTGHVPARPPGVTLTPGSTPTAWVGLRWKNFCGTNPADLQVQLVLPGDHVVPVAGASLWPTSSCVDATAPFVLEEGPVQAPVTG